MKISYAILVKDEIDYIKPLIERLNVYKDEEDEIVILQDIGPLPTDKQLEVKKYILDETFSSRVSYYFSTTFKDDFSEIKNKLNSKCKGDYIFNIDADELPQIFLLSNIKAIIENNPEIDLFMVPRINTVVGLTQAHIDRWRWRMTLTEQYGHIVNYPDYQGRVYKNTPEIKWKNKVHEVITGNKTHADLPWFGQYEYAILHHKDIERQEKQNAQYEGMI